MSNVQYPWLSQCENFHKDKFERKSSAWRSLSIVTKLILITCVCASSAWFCPFYQVNTFLGLRHYTWDVDERLLYHSGQFNVVFIETSSPDVEILSFLQLILEAISMAHFLHHPEKYLFVLLLQNIRRLFNHAMNRYKFRKNKFHERSFHVVSYI